MFASFPNRWLIVVASIFALMVVAGTINTFAFAVFLKPVSTDLGDFVPATIELALAGLFIAVVLGFFFAFATTLRWPGAGVFRSILLVGASIPTFLLGIGGILIFYRNLNWLPAAGQTSINNAPTGPTGLLTVDGILHGRLDVACQNPNGVQ